MVDARPAPDERALRLQRFARVGLPLVLLLIYATLGVVRVVSNALRDANLLRVTVGLVFGLAALGLVVLFARNPALRRPRTFGAAAALASVYALVLWPMDSPEERVHFVEYGLVGVLAFFALPLRWSDVKRGVVAAFVTAAAGWLDEGIQALLPSRYYDLRDVGFNALAGVLALAALVLFRFLARR
ncbi:MAG: VanZ family protein [Myxococcaceae bacterium]|nr:VanZ family protein [Myxococcaceae bacterium]